MANAIPVTKQEETGDTRTVPHAVVIVPAEVVEAQVKKLPEDFREAAKDALAAGKKVSMIGAKVMRVDN